MHQFLEIMCFGLLELLLNWKILTHDALKIYKNVKAWRHQKTESNKVFVKYMDVILICLDDFFLHVLTVKITVTNNQRLCTSFFAINKKIFYNLKPIILNMTV